MDTCPCGTNQQYSECCGKYHSGSASAPTAEALMRSRYSAFVKGEIDYIQKTIPLLQRKSFDRRSTKEWSEQSQWLGLEILSAKGGIEDKRGKVEFIARFQQNGVEHTLHEISSFEKIDGKWLYVSGKIIGS